MLFTLIYAFIIMTMSFITMSLYGIDKRKAVREKMRIPERALLSMGLFGGALGALVGMFLFSHKTKHIYFWILNCLFLIIQIALFVFIAYLEIKYFI